MISGKGRILGEVSRIKEDPTRDNWLRILWKNKVSLPRTKENPDLTSSPEETLSFTLQASAKSIQQGLSSVTSKTHQSPQLSGSTMTIIQSSGSQFPWKPTPELKAFWKVSYLFGTGMHVKIRKSKATKSSETANS